MARVDAGGAVVQVRGYEGSVTAANGPASGLTSDSLPVAEDSCTPAGTSLQLRGSGSGYGDFSWAGSSADSFGACNDGQSFSGSNPAPILVSTTRSEEHTSELQSLMRISYAVFCLKKKTQAHHNVHRRMRRAQKSRHD